MTWFLQEMYKKLLDNGKIRAVGWSGHVHSFERLHGHAIARRKGRGNMIAIATKAVRLSFHLTDHTDCTWGEYSIQKIDLFHQIRVDFYGKILLGWDLLVRKVDKIQFFAGFTWKHISQLHYSLAIRSQFGISNKVHFRDKFIRWGFVIFII